MRFLFSKLPPKLFYISSVTARRGVAAVDSVPGDAVSASHETAMKGSRAMKCLKRARMRAIGLATTAALAALAGSATSAVAAMPWWHVNTISAPASADAESGSSGVWWGVTSGSRPASLRSGESGGRYCSESGIYRCG